MNKAGFVGDLFFILIIFLATGLLFLAMYAAFSKVETQLLTNKDINSSAMSRESVQSMGTILDKLDFIFMAVVIGSVIGVMVVSFLLPAHPIFLVVYLIMTIIGAIIGAIFSNVWEAASVSPGIAAFVVHFPAMNELLLHLPLFVCVVGLLATLAMFAKPGGV